MRKIALIVVLLLALASAAQASGAGGGGGDREVRVAGTCGSGARATLRVRARDGGLEVRFQLRQSRGRGAWRVAVVHESRVAARATVRTTRLEDSFEVRRVLPDLPGSDVVGVRAWGPSGLGCRALASVGESDA